MSSLKEIIVDGNWETLSTLSRADKGEQEVHVDTETDYVIQVSFQWICG